VKLGEALTTARWTDFLAADDFGVAGGLRVPRPVTLAAERLLSRAGSGSAAVTLARFVSTRG
jgi:hypothetical protein